MDLDALKAAVGPATAGIMLTNPSTLGVFEHKIVEVARVVHEAGGLLVLRRSELECDPGQGPPRRHGIRRDPHEPAQDLLDAARRRRSRIRRGGRRTALAAVSADPAGRQGRRRAIDGSPSATCRIDRPAVGIHGQRRRQSARLHLHAHAGSRGHGAGRRIRDAQRELSAEAADGSRLRGRLPDAGAPATSSSSR